MTKDFARLEVKVDYLVERLDEIEQALMAHTQSRIRHFGTIIGASGPLLVVLLELLRRF